MNSISSKALNFWYCVFSPKTILPPDLKSAEVETPQKSTYWLGKWKILPGTVSRISMNRQETGDIHSQTINKNARLN